MRPGSSVSAARLRAIGLVGGIIVSAAILASCAPQPEPSQSVTETPQPTASVATTAPPTPTSDPDPGPELIPDGTAADNLPLFKAVTAKVWASDHRVEGRAYIDALVSVGFPKDRMQVTADQTTIGRAAESLQFSVAWGDDECLIGQVGPSTGKPVTKVMPQLAKSRCLVGSTRPIDW